ncbi:GNAT family N-acetyltransferase [Mucilaginibacter panaciglaebae]|uniref:N-acetyltransferase domain-containing protein n=1 Tax=Mucilaginibacter panaciglaebae TaxID=502331 RepID=A0ABP7WIA9_9SPHI
MILTITTENLEDCVYAFLKAYNGPPWNYNWTYEKAKKYLSEYVESGRFVGFVLYDEDKIVGATFGHIKTWWTSEQLMIDEFFISGEKQGMGYGKKLLSYCDQYASENNIGSIVLMTNRYMPAYGFYNKIGYTTTEQYVFMFKQII